MTQRKVSYLALCMVAYSCISLDRIRHFLSSYSGKGIERGFADLDLDGDDTPSMSRLKYMGQLVRELHDITRPLLILEHSNV
jgi:hypothetical protein